MIDPAAWLAFALASALIVIVPGPTVTVIVANSLRYGAAAGLWNVAGTQAGLAIMVAVLAFGFAAVVALVGEAFFWLKLAGAAYLVWLGVRLLRGDGRLAEGGRARADGSFVRQGFLVIWSNPKALFFLGAFLPQFVDPARNPVGQTLALGATFMAIATLFDSAYALLAGRTGVLLARRNVRLVELCGGSCLIGGGLWLALSRR